MPASFRTPGAAKKLAWINGLAQRLPHEVTTDLYPGQPDPWLDTLEGEHARAALRDDGRAIWRFESAKAAAEFRERFARHVIEN
jgi:hypothetical protein